MKKLFTYYLAMIILCSFLTGCAESTNFEKSQIETAITKENLDDYVIDYKDASSFENALNNGEDVNEKIVQFEVYDYVPVNILGINCQAGEHLNFILNKKADIHAGDIVVGRVTMNASKVFGESWKIPFEVIEITKKASTENIDIYQLFDTETAENIKAIAGISNIRLTTTDYDEGFEDKPTAVLFFNVDNITDSNKDSDYWDDDYVKMVNEGGCVEIYKTAEIATSRNSYLLGFYMFGLTGGKHESVNNYVIQISNALTEEAQESLLTELSNILIASNTLPIENNDEASIESEVMLTENQTTAPADAYMLSNDNVDEVVELFSKSGFINIQTQAIYDLDYTSVWSSTKLDWVEMVSIDEISDFKEGDIFEKDAIVIISYHAYEKDDPNITYTKYTISELFDDLESNPMRAKDKHLDEYIEIEGKISEISPHGKYIFLCETNDIYGLNFIYCGTETSEFIDHVYNLSKGDIVKVRGKINVVNTIYDYTMDVYSFQ